MVGQGGLTASGARARRSRSRTLAVLGGVALIAVLTAVLAAVLGPGEARGADRSGDPGPQPYGGALERVDPGEQISGGEVLEVAMLGLGTVNGLAFAVAMIASRLRGPSAAQTRRALIARTDAGVVSEPRRERRRRARLEPAPPVPPPPAARADAPPARASHVAAPARAGRAVPAGLVPMARARYPVPRERAAGPGGAVRPAPMSPPVGVPMSVRARRTERHPVEPAGSPAAGATR